MSEREDYGEPGAPPLWERPAVRRRVLKIGIVGLLLFGLGVLLVVFLTSRWSDRHYMTHLSISRATDAAEACRIYRDLHPKGMYPAKLADLLPFLDNSERSLKDAWGDPFRYALVLNPAGVLEPHFWTERTRDGKTTLHGAKLAADGTVVRFGVPED